MINDVGSREKAVFGGVARQAGSQWTPLAQSSQAGYVVARAVYRVAT